MLYRNPNPNPNRNLALPDPCVSVFVASFGDPHPATTFPNPALKTTPIPWQRVESTTKKRRTRSSSRPVFYKNIWKTFVVFVRFVVQKIQASPPCALCLREKYKEWICPVLLSRFSPLQVTLTTKLQKNPPFQNSSIPTLQRKNTHKTVVSWVF